MHAGNIENKGTKANKLYRLMKTGQVLSSFNIVFQVPTVVPSTVLSEVRGQLPKGEVILKRRRIEEKMGLLAHPVGADGG